MIYSSKNKDYYLNVRLDLISLLPTNSKNLKVLEIGAGYGATLSHLKNEKKAIEVVAIDLSAKENKSPFKNIDTFIYGDVEKIELSKYNNYFDVIILADVLEHLISPKEVLKKIKPLLNNQGNILISIPNIRHKSALYKIFVKGDFSYEESGLFDFTHLRFFCKKNIKELVSVSGFKINNMVSSLDTYNKKSFSKLLNILTFRVFEEFLTVQYLLIAKKKK